MVDKALNFEEFAAYSVVSTPTLHIVAGVAYLVYSGADKLTDELQAERSLACHLASERHAVVLNLHLDSVTGVGVLLDVPVKQVLADVVSDFVGVSEGHIFGEFVHNMFLLLKSNVILL